MADIRTIMDDATRLANTVSAVIPAAGYVGVVADIADKVIEIIDTLKQHPTGADLAHTQAQMQEARATLAARVKIHAASTAAHLRGEE